MPCVPGFRPATRPGLAPAGESLLSGGSWPNVNVRWSGVRRQLSSKSSRRMKCVPCAQGFRPVTRPGLAPAGESLLSAGSERSNQEREPNVHVHRGVQRHSARCVHRRRTQTKCCSIRARASGPGPRSTLRRRNVAHAGAQRRRRVRPAVGAVMQSAWCRRAVGSVMQSARCTPVTTPVHGWGSICSQFSGGEHTVPNAVARPGVHERSKTFLIPFGVYQKEFACRGETRPDGSR
jgi:hypothetical protein